MFETVGASGNTGGVTVHSASASAPAPAESAAASTGVTRVALSPRIKSDPAAGIMIAEYLSSTGEKQLQTPSAAVVAYLRSGLTAEGLPQHDDVQPVKTEA
ncbi:MAG TPA: hypothetical protein DCY07_01005 [Rhodospirillaceae bacterium]|nr:hypothetical protein [Rhodospirillaceae bacterium]